MGRQAGLLIILVALSLLARYSINAVKYNVTVGYLPCIKGTIRDRQGITISGAVSMALEDINNSTEILPDVNLKLMWNDTKCDTVIATKLITNMRSAGVVAFFGPEGRCRTEDIIAVSGNLPMISYKCYDQQPSTLTNFARLNPPETQATKSVISLLRYYRWKKITILYEELWQTVALALENHAEKNNITVNHRRLITDSFTCCEEKMTCCNSNYWYQHLQNTKTRSRIYVFLGSTSSLIDMMTTMEALQMFEKGEYMVIFIDMMSYSLMESTKYLISPEDRGTHNCPNTPFFKKRAQSLLVVVATEPENRLYEDFTNRVQKYNILEPFNLPQPILMKDKFIKFVSIYAAYLYDSVKLYATALHSLIEEDGIQTNKTLTYEKLMTIASNGPRIVSKMITLTPFKSVSGMSINLDERAESEGNFSVLAFKSIISKNKGLNCTYSMIPVGHFQQSTREYPEFKLNPRLPIDWPDNVKPEDEPCCGFLNLDNPKNDPQTLIIVIGTLVIIFVLCPFLLYIYCKKSRKHHGPNKFFKH